MTFLDRAARLRLPGTVDIEASAGERIEAVARRLRSELEPSPPIKSEAESVTSGGPDESRDPAEGETDG